MSADPSLQSDHPLDRADPLAVFPDRFVRTGDVVAYLDGNSLGRPLRATADRFADFLTGAWGTGLIRSWDEQWMALPATVGDRIGALTLGAAPGQTVVADSTTVLLYKAIRAALDAAGPDRDEIVLDDDQFPTDRFVVDGIARECGATVRRVPVDPDGGVRPEDLAPVLGPRTAVVLVNHVSYRSGWLADLDAVTAQVHDAGALVVWDLCHSVGVVPMSLDDAAVDLAVGCTYKFLNGGPGAPAFLYAGAAVQERFAPPVQGWMGAADVFAMGATYEPAPGVRRFVSGTPPIVGMLAVQDMLDVIEEAGMEAVRTKSTALTEHAFAVADTMLAPLGVRTGTPRDPASRGSHVSLRHPAFRQVVDRLWARGVVPDFRNPDALRVGLLPLSTTFAELEVGMTAIRDELVAVGATAGVGSEHG